MSKVLVTKSKLDSLAESVSTKSGEQLPLTIDEMKDAVDHISGGSPTLETVTKSYTPTESQQTDTIEPSTGYDGIEEVNVTVGAISSSYVGSGITRRSSTDLAASGNSVTAPAGYYSSSASKSVASGTAGTPTATKGTVSNHSISVTPSVTNTTGYITGSTKTGTAVTVSASELVSGDKSITQNGTNIDVTNYETVSVAVPSGSPNLQAKTNINPSTSSQTITADNGYDGLSSVQINAMPTQSLPTSASSSGTGSTKATISRSTSDQYINIPTGYNSTAVNYKFSAVANGTAGTPTATKGTVSNNIVSVTPSVTNTTGYITGSTKTGTAVSVSASELVSGTLSITENGTADVTNYASVNVNVSGGGGGSLTVASATKTLTASANSISFTNLSGSPTSFVITSSADQSTGGTKAVAVAYDGTNLFGMDITTQAANDTGFSKSYSNGTLTVTATSATFEANEYKLVYTYGGSSSDIHTADVQVGSGATSITFSSLSGKPAYFSCVFKSSFGTSSGYQRVIDVVNDGTNTYGHAFDSSAKAQTSWSYSYSGGSLTISSTGTNNGGYFHQPGYYQLTYAVDPNALNLQQKTGIGASTSSQTITADNGYDGLESVQINPVSQTNLIAGNIKSGTTISISNGSTNLWSVTGTYTGGGGSSKNVQTNQSTSRTTSTSLTSVNSLTCSTAGTYDVYWTCTRSSTSGTWSSRLYIGGTASGSEQTTWSNHVQTVKLTGVSINANQTVAVYAKSRGSNYYAYAPQLTIVQTS